MLVHRYWWQMASWIPNQGPWLWVLGFKGRARIGRAPCHRLFTTRKSIARNRGDTATPTILQYSDTDTKCNYLRYLVSTGTHQEGVYYTNCQVGFMLFTQNIGFVPKLTEKFPLLSFDQPELLTLSGKNRPKNTLPSHQSWDLSRPSRSAIVSNLCQLCKFSQKQRNFLHNLPRTKRFTHTECDFARKLLEF